MKIRHLAMTLALATALVSCGEKQENKSCCEQNCKETCHRLLCIFKKHHCNLTDNNTIYYTDYYTY